MAGSVSIHRAGGHTSRTASTDANTLRTSCRFIEGARLRENGWKMPARPAAHEKKEISLTGQKISFSPNSEVRYSVAARENAANRSTKAGRVISRSSG